MRRWLSGTAACRRAASTWARSASQHDNLVQSYISTADDPFLNLSIEHFLLQQSPQRSAVIFLYVNRPCVVIGRNQNPWLEVNLRTLRNEGGPPGKVDLVRRRSGGGTVFHDSGNVNWTVISPSEAFTRDKHAEMIVWALRKQGVERARVNERHDIVLDQGSRGHSTDAADLHKTPFTSKDLSAPKSVKVSGSAYKLTRGRALHHGTCLLNSPNLGRLSSLLRSPAQGYIQAKGVESVSSPVSNIGLGTDVFQKAVQEEFRKMYGAAAPLKHISIGDDAMAVEQIMDGVRELRTPEWLWDQTPTFTLSSRTHDGDGGKLALNLKHASLRSANLSIECKRGQIVDARFSTSSNAESAAAETQRFRDALLKRQLKDEWTWDEVVRSAKPDLHDQGQSLAAEWLEEMLPRPHRLQ